MGGRQRQRKRQMDDRSDKKEKKMGDRQIEKD